MSRDVRPRAGSRAILAAIAVGAAAWFASTMLAGGELSDTGMILYPGWLVSLGLVPYRDFPHVYGPSLFAVNGALFRLFGADLLAVRVSLVVLKTVTVLLVYVLSARVAPRAIAVGAAVVTAAVWGPPWWIGVTPYAIFYQLPLTLAAAALVGRPDPPGPRRALAAGALVGAAATFKHTGGLFGFLAVALFVLAATAGGAADAAAGRRGRLLRAGAVLAAVGVAIGYVATYGVGLTQAILVAPFAFAGGVLAAREVTARDTERSRRGLVSAAWLAAGAALPFAIYAVFFAVVGGGRAALADTLLDVPHRIRWYEPLGWPPPRGAVLVALVLAVGAFRTRTAWTCAAAVGGVLSLLGLAFPAVASEAVAYVVERRWYVDVLHGFVWVLIGLAAGGVALARRDGAGAAWLLALLAATTLLQLHPAADIPHAVLVTPGVAPVAAYVAARLVAGRARAIAATLASAILAAPFGDAVVRYRFATTPYATAPHATGIAFDTPELIDAADLARYLASSRARPGPVYLLSGDSLVYLLAGRRSVFEREEFFLYLCAIDIVSADDARALVDEDAMVERLVTIRPLVIDRTGTSAPGRIRATFPRLAEAIDAHYRPVAQFGAFRVLAWTEP